MAERLSDREPEQNRAESAAELEKVAAPSEVDQAKIERERRSAEQAERAAAEKLEALKSREAIERTEQAKSKEQLKPEREPKPGEGAEKPQGLRNKDDQTAFRQEISAIQAHLSPASRQFSRIVHNPAVETVSEVLEETLFRPAIVLTAAVGAVLVGGVLYLFAKVRGYPFGGSEFVVGLIIGAGLGIIGELVRYPFTRRRKNSR